MTQQTTMLTEELAPKLLPRILSRFDLTAIYFSLIFASYGAGQMASLGWAAILMLLLAAVIVLLPSALAAYELGTVFTGEGGIYIWAHKTFGPIHGFISGWLSWLPVIFVISIGVSVSIAHLQLAFHVTWPKWIDLSIQMVLIWFEVYLSSRNLKASQQFIRVAFFVSLSTAIIVFVVGLLQTSAVTPVTSDIYSLNIFQHGALFSAAVLWLLGVEMPFTMGAEYSHHRKTAGTMLIWGSLALMIGYLIGTAGILMSIPQSSVDVTKGVAQAVAAHYPWLGTAVALAICFAVMGQDVAYMNAYSRLLFVSALEKRLPAYFGQVSAKQVPVRAMIGQAIGVSLVTLVFGLQDNSTVTFNICLAALTAIWCASIYYIYGAVVIARKKYPELYQNRGNDIWTIPGGKAGLWVVTIWGVIANTITIYYVFALPWVTDGISVAGWRWSLIAIMAIVTIVGIGLYQHSLKQRESV